MKASESRGCDGRRLGAFSIIACESLHEYPAAEADRGRHFGFPGLNVFAGGPGSLAVTFGGRVVGTMDQLFLNTIGFPVQKGTISRGREDLDDYCWEIEIFCDESPQLHFPSSSLAT
jgi:hypothetical protein